jgi:hypothetical protein
LGQCWNSQVIPLFALVALAGSVLLYGPALHAPFIFDDSQVVPQASPVWGTRFVGFFSFWLNRELALRLASPEAFYFRIVNVVIHALASTALVALARELTPRRWLPVIAGAIFLVHPIQTAAVTYVTQRFESLATLFMLVAAFSYVRFRKISGWPWLVAFLAAGAAAGSTKETALVLPVWLLLIECTCFSGRAWRLLYAVIPASLLVAYPAWWAFGSASVTFGSSDWPQYFMNQGTVLTKYLALSMWPGEQFLFYDVLPVETLTFALAAQWAFIVGAISSALYFRRSLAGFGVLTFFIMLLPVTLIPLPDLIFEHRIYPAFAGIALAFAALLDVDRRKLSWAIVLALVLAWGARTIQRNGEWTDEVLFLERHRARFPDSPDILMRLGGYYFTRGQYTRAVALTERAHRNVDRLNAYYRSHVELLIEHNLVNLHLLRGDIAQAESAARRAIILNPTHELTHKIEERLKHAQGVP